MMEIKSTDFNVDVAEFPYFCNEDVFIGNMFQVAKIKLDEEGTEVAAVSVIEMATSGIHSFTEFYATRPFLYVISEQSTGIIFFIGQYVGDVSANVISGIATTCNPTLPQTSSTTSKVAALLPSPPRASISRTERWLWLSSVDEVRAAVALAIFAQQLLGVLGILAHTLFVAVVTVDEHD